MHFDPSRIFIEAFDKDHFDPSRIFIEAFDKDSARFETRQALQTLSIFNKFQVIILAVYYLH